jgi:hypothetical protein
LTLEQRKVVDVGNAAALVPGLAEAAG